MMRALAEFIMRGRWQAATVALLGSWFLALAPAAVALVALRRGVLDGFIVMLWAMLPPLAGFWLNTASDVAVYLVTAVLVTTLISALVLKISVSWSQALVVLAVSAAILSGLAVVMAEDSGSDLIQALLAPLTAEQVEELLPGVHSWSAMTITGWFAYLVASSGLISVLFGRWLQALLYNPGGLQQEMHNLRLPVAVALSSAVIVAWSLSSGTGSEHWAKVAGLPLVVAGIGLVHWVVKLYGLGLLALIVFYVALVRLESVFFLVATLALVDAMANLRIRFKLSQ